jgi:hypothetical protein
VCTLARRRWYTRPDFADNDMTLSSGVCLGREGRDVVRAVDELRP